MALLAKIQSAIVGLGLAGVVAAQNIAATAAPADLRIDTANAGAPLQLEYWGNMSRLPALVLVTDSADLERKSRDPRYVESLRKYLRARYPMFSRFRIGNLFFGYQCAGWHFKELAVRDAHGEIRYQFDETIRMLDMLVRAGFRPGLALTGLPKALLPAGEQPIAHPAYGCVNAPPIDWSRSEPRERARDWWNLQAAFFRALIDHFGLAEVRQWEFATWTEPYNASRSHDSHLVVSRTSADDAQYDAAVATILAASIDAAMEAGLPIHIGNFAGNVKRDYPRVIEEIRRFPKGRQYLDAITGFAVSAYRVKPSQDFAAILDERFSLGRSSAMPGKPIFLDEFGELVDDFGAKPPRHVVGLETGGTVALVLQKAYSFQDGSASVPSRVAFWDHSLGSREAAAPGNADEFIPSAATNVLRLFAGLNGRRKLVVEGGRPNLIAAGGAGEVYLVATGERSSGICNRAAAGQSGLLNIRLTGLRKQAEYRVEFSSVGAESGNPLSVFLQGAPSYVCDRDSFSLGNGQWLFASTERERCFYEDRNVCSWRARARARSVPTVVTRVVLSDDTGGLAVKLSPEPGGTSAALVREAP